MLIEMLKLHSSQSVATQFFIEVLDFQSKPEVQMQGSKSQLSFYANSLYTLVQMLYL